MKDLKVQFATIAGRLINVDQAENNKDYEYRCPSCNCKLILRASNNKIRRKHFAHNGDNICEGYLESVIHKLAKQILYENKRLRVPSYSISIDDIINEDTKAMMESLNLDSIPIEPIERTIEFQNVVLEQFLSDEKRIKPDASCTNSEEEIYVEILYSHPTENKEEYAKKNMSCVEIDFSDIDINNNLQIISSQILNKFNTTNSSSWVSHHIDYDSINKDLSNKIKKQEEERHLLEIASQKLAREREKEEKRFAAQIAEMTKNYEDRIKSFSSIFKNHSYATETYGCSILNKINNNGYLRKILADGLSTIKSTQWRMASNVDEKIQHIKDILSTNLSSNERDYCSDILEVIELFHAIERSTYKTCKFDWYGLCKNCNYMHNNLCKNEKLLSMNPTKEVSKENPNGEFYTSDRKELILIKKELLGTSKDNRFKVDPNTILIRKGAFSTYLNNSIPIWIELPEDLQVIDDEIYFSTHIIKNTPKNIQFIGDELVNKDFWLRKVREFTENNNTILAELCLIKYIDIYGDKGYDYIYKNDWILYSLTYYFFKLRRNYPSKTQKLESGLREHWNKVCHLAQEQNDAFTLEYFLSIWWLQEPKSSNEIDQIYGYYFFIWTMYPYEGKNIEHCIKCAQLYIQKYPTGEKVTYFHNELKEAIKQKEKMPKSSEFFL